LPRLRHRALAGIVAVKTSKCFLVPRRVVDSRQTNKKDVDVVLCVLEPRLDKPAYIITVTREETILWQVPVE